MTTSSKSGQNAGLKVLIIEDEMNWAHLLADIIEAAGFTAFVTYDFYSGLEIARRYQPDVAVLESWHLEFNADLVEQKEKISKFRKVSPNTKMVGWVWKEIDFSQEIAGLFDHVLYKREFSSQDLLDILKEILNDKSTLAKNDVKEVISVPFPIISTDTKKQRKNYLSNDSIDSKKRKIFISYSRSDVDIAKSIHQFLSESGCNVWIDVFDLIPGQDWKFEIHQNIRSSDFFIACLSNNSVSKRGYIQRELKEAISILDEIPEGKIYIIPIRIDDCLVPPSLESKHWLDWYAPDAKEKLLKALNSKM